MEAGSGEGAIIVTWNAAGTAIVASTVEKEDTVRLLLEWIDTVSPESAVALVAGRSARNMN